MIKWWYFEIRVFLSKILNTINGRLVSKIVKSGIIVVQANKYVKFNASTNNQKRKKLFVKCVNFWKEYVWLVIKCSLVSDTNNVLSFPF